MELEWKVDRRRCHDWFDNGIARDRMYVSLWINTP